MKKTKKERKKEFFATIRTKKTKKERKKERMKERKKERKTNSLRQ